MPSAQNMCLGILGKWNYGNHSHELLLFEITYCICIWSNAYAISITVL